MGLTGLACAGAHPPQARPDALAPPPIASVEDAAAQPSAPSDAATAAIPAPEAPQLAPAATEPTPDAAAEFDYEPEAVEPDPFEPMNRGFFRLNQGLDHVMIRPLAQGYAWLVPAPGRRAVRRVFENLDAPVTVANSLLQLEVRHAAVATLRFVVNSTVGVAGLFDPAKLIGLAPVEADFGQTLGRLGVGTGPYIVLPLLGPTTARDGIGTLVDSALRPETWLLTPAEGLLLASSDGLTMRDEEGPALEALEQSSVDFYAALRAAYFMHRRAQVHGEADAPFLTDTPPAPKAPEPEPLPAALPDAVPAPSEPAAHAATQLGAASPLEPVTPVSRALPAAPAP